MNIDVVQMADLLQLCPHLVEDYLLAPWGLVLVCKACKSIRLIKMYNRIIGYDVQLLMMSCTCDAWMFNCFMFVNILLSVTSIAH